MTVFVSNILLRLPEAEGVPAKINERDDKGDVEMDICPVTDTEEDADTDAVKLDR